MEAPRDLPKPEDLFIEVHAARMVIREYESRLDRIECMAAEVCRRRYQRHAPKPQIEGDPPPQRKIA